MTEDKIQSIITSANSAFSNSERMNFQNLWEQSAKLCRPIGDTIQGLRSPGERKSTTRLVDIGIQSLNTFGAGLSSTLIPKGSKFFGYSLSKTANVENNDAINRWLNKCTSIANDYINESNFYSEFAKSLEDLGLIGTSLFLAEEDEEEGIRFKSYYVDSFAFIEDSNGRPDTVYFKITMTARQLIHKFGEDTLPEAVLRKSETAPDCPFKMFYVIGLRDKSKVDSASLNPTDHKYFAAYILEEEKHLIKETGFKTMPSSVGRWKQATNEIYGRSPAMEVQSTLALMNAMEYTKMRAAQRVANPQWLLPNDGSVRNLNNDNGGAIYYNASNPNAKPEQLADRSQPQLTDAYLEQKAEIIKDAFYIAIFNPLVDKQNMTLGEVSQRMAIANQNLIPNIARVIDELLSPTFKAIFQILADSGKFPVAPEGFNIKKITVNFISKAAQAVQALEVSGALQLAETITFLAQIDPAVVDYIDADAIVKLQAKALAVPNEAVRSDLSVKGIREQRAQQQAAQQAAEQAKIASDAYSKTSNAPDEGSPGAALMQQMGI